MDVFDINYYERLRSDYKQHRSLYVAYDYDNTVYDYHKKGIVYTRIIRLLRQCNALGFKLILFTGNEGKKLKAVKKDLQARKIPFDLVNENPLMPTRKPYYNILLDDRAGLKESYFYLNKLVDDIQNKNI